MNHPTQFFIKPAPGLKLRDPDSGTYLSVDGALTRSISRRLPGGCAR